MRVAILGNYPEDKNKILGGTHAVAWNLAEGLSRIPGVEVHAATFVQGLTATRHEVCNGVHEHYVPSNSTLGGLTFYSIDRRRLVGTLREVQPDVIHIHGSTHYPPCVWRSGFPWVMTPHGMIAKEAKMREGLRGKLRGPLEVWYERWAYRAATDVIVCSEYILPFVRGYTKARLHWVANAIGDRYFEIPNNEVPGTILFVGVITPRKGLTYLAQAMNILKQRNVQCKLCIVGKILDADYADGVRAYIDENELHDYIEWLGPVEEERLLELYGQCSVLVLPSLEETLPTVISQAMAAGKTVVGARSAGIPFMVHDGKTGLLANYGDSVDFADKIEAILSDSELRASMGEAAREEAKAKYSSASVAQTHLEIYEQIAGRSKTEAAAAKGSGDS